jgi:hypothetical protein
MPAVTLAKNIAMSAIRNFQVTQKCSYDIVPKCRYSVIIMLVSENEHLFFLTAAQLKNTY